MFSKISIKKELIKERSKRKPDFSQLLNEANQIIEQDFLHEKRIEESFKTAGANVLMIDVDDLNSENIFSEEEIKAICINYRLRFLDSNLYKEELPYEVVLRIKGFEKEYNCSLDKFKLVAPKSKFNLKDPNADPLLFVPLSNGKYYLMASWGNDMAWYKKFIYFPLRNFQTLFVTILSFCLLIAFLLPFDLTILKRFYISLHVFIFSFGVVTFVGMSFGVNLSSTDWKNKFIN